MIRYRVVLAAVVIAAVALVARPYASVSPLEASSTTLVRTFVSTGAVALGPELTPAAPQEASAAKENAGEESEKGSGWSATIAKAFNFAILVAVLVYFLRTPLIGYLDGRIGKVREDLVTAARTRETAARQLAEIAAKLKALPLEIEALKQRGAEDIVAERARIEQAAEAERERLLEHTRREIDMRLRVARRELLELTANLAVGIARDRITQTITSTDQTRLVDRYAAQLRADAAAGPRDGARL
jgi:F-type H+-transporting ATPase subunit b